MLAGVGGPTIAHAKRNMRVGELATWAAYRKKRGSLNHSLRLEEGFAHVLAAFYNMYSKEPVSADKFMPHVVGRIDEPETDDPEKVVSLLKGLSTKNAVRNKYLERRAARKKSR